MFKLKTGSVRDVGLTARRGAHSWRRRVTDPHIVGSRLEARKVQAQQNLAGWFVQHVGKTTEKGRGRELPPAFKLPSGTGPVSGGGKGCVGMTDRLGSTGVSLGNGMQDANDGIEVKLKLTLLALWCMNGAGAGWGRTLGE